MPRPLWYLLIGGLVVALVLGLSLLQPGALAWENDSPRIVYLLVLLLLVGSGSAAFLRTRPGTALRHAAIWLLIGLVVCAGYVLREDFALIGQRLRAELLPHQGVAGGEGVRFRAQDGGQFVVEAQVNGVPVRFLLDTGASDVTLTPVDARRLGFDPAALAYTRTYRTANGTVQGAPIRLRQVRVGPIEMADVAASVNAVGMDRSLLGMSFLSRLSSFQVTGETLTLTP